MSEVQTDFGVFRISPGDYDVNDGGDGVVMRLAFHPGADVDATKLGIVQVVNTVVLGEPGGLDEPILRGHSIPAGEPGAGTHVDQDPANRNPFYALSSGAGDGDALGDGQVHPGLGAVGQRFFRLDGTLALAPALLFDAPRVVGVGGPCSQVFESACVSIEGQQAGTYYGSVSWGWERGDDGVVRVKALERASGSGATAVLARAVELWNRARTAEGLATLPLALPPGAG